VPELHYMLPPEPRLPEARPMVDGEMYFVVHAPQPTGKTTTLRALARQLTAEGRWAALHFSCETGEPAGDDYGAAQDGVLGAIRREAQGLPVELRPPEPWPDAPAVEKLSVALSAWARACPRPLVLFFDEVDALRGESLRSLLRQLRDGYSSRPNAFPASVVLCGLRDVRDYKSASGGDPTRLGTSSPFNIKVASLRLGDFTEADLRALYAQHTGATGQAFTEEALARAWQYTAGQPWLVNALAAEVVDWMKIPTTEPITAEHIDTAKERLILARATHLDSLVARLHEPRVRRILEPLLAGDLPPGDETFDDDVAYVRDLGLIARDRPVRVANPIYREVIVRVLGSRTEEVILAEPRSFVLPDGRLDFDRLLREFADFWRTNGEILASRDAYHESAPQLVIMAFFHRLVNGGGFIDREYGLGMGRIDLLIRWRYRDEEGRPALQREAVELKVWRKGRPDPLTEGLAQLDDYLRRLDLDQGTLVIFDRRPDALPIEERTRFETAQTPGGRKVKVLRA
jgi:DNA polymerase III delta prime subunit